MRFWRFIGTVSVLPLNAQIGNNGLCTCMVWLSKSRGAYKGGYTAILRCRKGELIRSLSISLSFRLLQTTYSPIISVCKMFSCNAKQHMLFWLLKDAWLACNRCPFSVLPTPFWSPIKHLLKTTWQPVDLLLVTNLLFCLCLLYLQLIHSILCNSFSKRCLYFQPIKLRRALFRRRMME